MNRIEIITLNCWGLKYISKFTTERIKHIADVLVDSSCDIICLQEIWQEEHWRLLRFRLRKTFPFAKFYYSGMLGSGLAILSRYPISQTDMRPYTLNGRPQAFYRGDWFVGKGVASAVVDLPSGHQAQIFNTHMHAPYNEKVDTYLCHRTAQGWDLRKILKASVQAGYITFATGDFNSIPGSLVHRFLTTNLSDSFITLHPELPVLPDLHEEYSAEQLVKDYGVTCDVSPLNTWRRDQAPSMRPKRLDYVFHDHRVHPESVDVIFTDLLDGLQCSASDHFGLRCVYTYKEEDGQGHALSTQRIYRPLHLDDYDEIISMISRYTARETLHSRLRLGHFWISIAIIMFILFRMCTIHNPWLQVASAVSVLLIGVTGVVDGLIGLVFGWTELRGLLEFEDEVRRARSLHKETFE